MDWLTDPRVWVPLVLGLVAFIKTWSKYSQKSDDQQIDIRAIVKDVEAVKERQNRFDKDLALLQKDHSMHSETIADLVGQLREVVRDLQKVTIKIAIGEYGKT